MFLFALSEDLIKIPLKKEFSMSCFILNSPDAVWVQLSPVSPRKITHRSQFSQKFPESQQTLWMWWRNDHEHNVCS